MFQVISVSLNWEAERPPRCDEEGSIRSQQKLVAERENVLKECFSIPSGRKGFTKCRENEESFDLHRFGPLTVILINSDGAMYSTYERSTGFLDLQLDVLIQSTWLLRISNVQNTFQIQLQNDRKCQIKESANIDIRKLRG